MRMPCREGKVCWSVRAAGAGLAFTPHKAEVTRAVWAVQGTELGLSLPCSDLFWQFLHCPSGKGGKAEEMGFSNALGLGED